MLENDALSNVVDSTSNSSLIGTLVILGMLAVAVGAIIFASADNIKAYIARKKRTRCNLAGEICKTLEAFRAEIGTINRMFSELESRLKSTEKLKNEVCKIEKAVDLSKEQVILVSDVLNDAVTKEGKKSFWKGVFVSSIFLILSNIVTYLITKFA
ncbi:MAG: hypothetical protein PHO41_00710 [Eubacteriales bacterium]|nr:hypothetical protein [Eubacteriales bacterium]